MAVGFYLLIVFICIVLFALSGVLLADRISRFLAIRKNLHVASSSVAFFVLLLAFTALVAFGFSGSSIKIGIENTTFISNTVVPIIGESRAIRSDEAMISTPMAVGQYNHFPRFPVVNKNLGPEGQNMLIVGGSGVPVQHVSAFAKPATWGFFFLDLAQALAWYWWFPVFGGLIAVWSLMNLLFPGRWKLMLALSASYIFSPYASAWSFTPAYAVMFPSLALAFALFLLKNRSWPLAIFSGLFLGLSLSGFVLFLYPAWQVPLGYLFLSLFIGMVIRDRLFRFFAFQPFVSFILALSVASFVLYFWWIDAHEAIKVLTETVYPGQRLLVTGGDLEPSYWVRGISSIVTLRNDFGYSNSCEMASFIYLILPVFFGIAVYMLRTRRVDPVALLAALFFIFISYYQFVGIPSNLAKISLWGSSGGSRADIAVGFSQLILVAFLLTRRPFNQQGSSGILLGRFPAILVSLLWSGLLITFFVIMTTFFVGFNGQSRVFSYVVALLVIFLTGVASFYLLSGRGRHFAVLYCLITFVISFPFNPLVRAPDNIAPRSDFLDKRDPSVGRVLVLGGGAIQAMMLMASGFSVLNGVHYYPQFQLWKKLDPSGKMNSIYNRYQHLDFGVSTFSDALAYRIENPIRESVMVIVDGGRFNFGTIGVNTVIAKNEISKSLAHNPHLIKKRSVQGWSVYQTDAQHREAVK